MLVAIIAAASCACLAGTNKTGGNYEALQDVINARGGSSSGGDYYALSSIGQRSSNRLATGGDFSCVSGLLGSVDTTAPTVAVTNPTAGQSTNGSVSLVGTAFDQNNVQWTLYVGPGASPSSWSQVATGSGNNADSFSFGAWDSSRFSGSYTYKLVAVDSRGNTAQGTVTFNVDYTLTITGSVPVMQWVFMGLPVAPADTNPISIFGNGEYKIFRWNPEVARDQYTDQYRFPSSIEPGYGFWIKSYAGVMNYSYSAARTRTSEQYALPIKSGWNQISSPYDVPFNWSSVQVRKDGSTYDLATAMSLGLIHSSFYSYDPAGGSWVPSDTGAAIAPQTGYYVRAYDNVDLMFDQSARVLSRIIRPAEDYRAKISVSVNGRNDIYNYFGAANTASSDFDTLDSEEPPQSMNDIEDGKFVSLYFPKTEWQKNAGKYSADFRLTGKAGQTESWDFVVETNETGKTATLNWDSAALPSDRYSFTLVDLASGAQINMAGQNSYTYAVSGAPVSTARFRIQVVRLSVNAAVVKYTLKPGWNLVSAPIDTEVTSALEQLGDDLKILDIFQYFDGRFYPAEKADIQAGLGYWMYVAESAEIDIEGVPVGPEVRVPLKSGWNLIGNPFETELPWGDNISFSCNGSNYTLSGAVSASMTNGAIFEFTGEAYQPSVSLLPWKGYFLKTSQDCELVLKR